MNVWNIIVLVAGTVATPVLIWSYVSQIVGLLKTKSAEDAILSFWYILDTALLCLFILAVDGFINGGGLGLMVAQAINLLLALGVTVLTIYYKRVGGK